MADNHGLSHGSQTQTNSMANNHGLSHGSQTQTSLRADNQGLSQGSQTQTSTSKSLRANENYTKSKRNI
jgi:hypothetical protein